MIVDVHCHYAFPRLLARVCDRFSFESAAPPVPSEYPTSFDSCVSPRARRRLTWRIAQRAFNLPVGDEQLNRRLATEYEQHLLADGPIERFVLLAFDAVHDDQGRCPPLPTRRAELGSDLYASNSLVRDMCRRHPGRFLFGASVHPYRPNAVACVEEVFAAGACLLKWIPLHHNIDIADPRTLAVLRRLATLGLPLLVHVGEEFTLTTQRPAFRSITPLLGVLRSLRRNGGMPAVIVAHAATPVTPLGDRKPYRALLAALAGEFADAPLYADISALATWGKAGFLRELLRRPDLHHKLLFGSDFPVPPLLHRLHRDLGRDYARVAAVRSWPQRAALAYRQLGFNEIVFHRAATILPHVDFFARPASVLPA